MMIVEAICASGTEYEVYFLLTSYVETLAYCDKLKLLHPRMTDLPLRGKADIARRAWRCGLELAKSSRDESDAVSATIREALSVFGAALDRLDLLGGLARASLSLAARGAGACPAPDRSRSVSMPFPSA